MRPLKLRMSGFAAFREDTEVDFRDVELAALVGPTGSGKSTVIDGITFALFGTVARYDDARAVAPVISQLANEARVSLDFEADGQAYTAVRVVRRTPGGATTKEARLERGDEVLAGRASEMASAVERMLGLDFDRFTKTVVLPQGRFAQFLHDKASDRQELLRHLLDLVVYTRMGEEARQRAAKASAQIAALEPELQTEAPTSEQIAGLAAAAEGARVAQAELKGIMDDLAEVVASLESARDELRRFQPMRDRAVEAATVPESATILASGLLSARQVLATAEEAHRNARLEAVESRRRADDGPNAELCRRLIDDHRRLAELDQELVGRETDVERAQIAAGAASEEADKVRHRIDEAADEVADARSAARAARQSAAEGPRKGELEATRSRWSEFERLGRELVQACVERQQAETAEAAAEARRGEAQRSLDEAVESLDRVRAVKQAEGLVAQLREGEPCPVCRQTVVSLPDHDVDREFEQCRTARDRAGDALKGADSELDEARTVAAEARAAARGIEDSHEALEAQLRDAPDKEALDRLEARADELEAAAAVADDVLKRAEQAEGDLREADDTRQALKAESEAAQTLVRTTAERDGCLRQRDELTNRLAGEPDVAELEERIAEAERLAAACDRASADEEAAREAETTARGRLDERVAEEKQARTSFGRVRDGLAELSPPEPGESLIEDWQQLAAWAEVQVVELSARVEAAEERERAAGSSRADLVEQARRLCAPYFEPGDDPDRLAGGMAEAAWKAELLREQAVEARKARVKLEERIAGLRSDEAVASQLGRLLQANGFERWLLEEAVADLVERANHRLLQLSDQQYSFVAEGTSFDIRDHHNADEVRGAKTLSGGETFLASLALALALSDGQAEMAAESSAGLDSLFLDEGFGTLDPDALDGVAAAIEELGAAGRMVCIITHIRELAERMPVRFEVSKGPTTSSVERIEV